jgi:ABC-type antimicrobial peptide transport system permease subunit
VRSVVFQGVTLAAIGIAAGLGLAAVAGPLLARQLFGIGPFDPLTLAAVPALLLVVATVACYVPARRALGIDPVSALRN